MTQDEIIGITRKLGICAVTTKPKQSIRYLLSIHEMQRITELVAELAAFKEREACADLVENFEYQDKTGRHDVFFLLPHEHVAKAIRARNID